MGLFDRFKKPAGTPLLRELIERYALAKKAPAEQSLIGAEMGTALFDFALLQLPRLSASVREVAIFDNRRGLSLALDASATRDTIDADLTLAHAVLQALEQ